MQSLCIAYVRLMQSIYLVKSILMLFALLGLQNTIALCVWLKRGMSDLKIIADTVIDSFEGRV